MIEGALISESLRPGSTLSGVPMTVREIRRYALAEPGPDQPSTWTLLDFETPDDQAGPLATALAACLLPEGGWYCNFHTGTEAFVVFADKIFRYPRGDSAGRAEAAGYARSVGVPEPQLDWTD
jgi:hypothetical protein